jgi:hypothetical protein
MVQCLVPFDTKPIVIDVTFKAVEKGYYLSPSVIKVKELRKIVVFFQAIINDQAIRYH